LPPSGLLPVMLYLPAMSGAGALLVVELLLFLVEPVFVFEVELEVEVVVDLQPITTLSSNTKAITAGCRDTCFIMSLQFLNLTVGLYISRHFLSTISAVSIVAAS
jgi:hypothetical protein